MQELVRAAVESLGLHIRATWAKHTPVGGLATDAPTASVALRKTLSKWGSQWQDRFNKLSTEMAGRFAAKAASTTEAAFKNAAAEAGFTVKFQRTPEALETYHAVIAENINLIRNLGRETLDDIQGKVWASVREGHDMGTLSLELNKIAGINMRRAALIARDQNNKAKAVIEDQRRKEVGIKEAIWLHSGGGKTPRPTHVEAGRKKVRYNIGEGWYDPAVRKRIWPGTEINCRCTSKAVIPGLDESFY